MLARLSPSRSGLAQIVDRQSVAKFLSTATAGPAKRRFKLVIVGGGAAGAALSNKFASKLGKNELAVVEPHKFHWYQPGWTMVGGGLKTFEQTRAPMADILSPKAVWLQDRVAKFRPDQNTLVTTGGIELQYEFLIVAVGVKPKFELIKGLPEAFSTPGVCSNYDPNFVQLTFKAIQNFTGGTAVFTFPSGPIKCAGAPQKIAYMADSIWRKAGVRDKTKIVYNTALPAIFGVPKYAAALNRVAESRNIEVNFRHNLIEVKPDDRLAVFDVLDADGKLMEKRSYKYDFLHIGPPCRAPVELASAPELIDSAGFLDVDKESLQHRRFPNIFGIGDCTNIPTAKTAAAVASQLGTMRQNLTAALNGKPLKAKYDGYASCPLITSGNRVILAEFSGFTGEPMETFPVDQSKERYSMFLLKRHFMPFLYWNLFTKGWWEGPGLMRKAMRLGLGK